MLITNYFYFLIQAYTVVIILVSAPLAHGLKLNGISLNFLCRSNIFFILIHLSFTYPKILNINFKILYNILIFFFKNSLKKKKCMLYLNAAYFIFMPYHYFYIVSALEFTQ